MSSPIDSKKAWALLLFLLLTPGRSLLGDTFTVTSTADAGPGTLRQAILNANSHPGLDTIAFNIPGAGVQTILVSNALPTVTDAATIDGYTQPEALPNSLTTGLNTVLRIELDGTRAAGPDGLVIATNNCTIRGLVINRFALGAAINLLASSSNMIAGNFLGTDAQGRIPYGNKYGFLISGAFNLVGGLTPDARNLISGNLGEAAVFGNAGMASQSSVLGNLVGTDAAGLAPVGNGPGLSSIFGPGGSTFSVRSAADLTFGGREPGAGNVISGNSGVGFHIYPTVSNTLLMGNLIGVAADGVSALGNTNHGVAIDGGVNNRTGGLLPGAGNIIAFNGGDGVAVFGGSGHWVLGNSIFGNGRLGIDLNATNGVTQNDPGDTDPGANGLQNYPVITSTVTASNFIIYGTLNSGSNTSYTIQVFGNDHPDGTYYGEGQTLLGTTNLTTDGGGNVSFQMVFDLSVLSLPWFAATATDPAGNTSEFSQDTALSPFIVSSPTNQTTTLGSNATFHVLAGGLDVDYQWRFNGKPLPRATNSVLALTNVQLSAEGTYSAIVSNSLGQVESSGATLGVVAKVVILEQPHNQTAVQGDTVVLKVVATGGPAPINYSWRLNGGLVPGQSNAILVLPNVQATNAGGYRVAVSTVTGGLLSSNAVVTVLADRDGDHMPDGWESANNLNPNDPGDGGLDSDGDGMTNLQEYIAGTDPHNPESFLRIDQITVGAGGVQVQFVVVSNKTYSVLGSDALGGGWLKLGDVVSPSTNVAAVFRDTNPPPARVYRLVTPRQQ